MTIGYDMYIVGDIPGEQENVERARAVEQAARAALDGVQDQRGRMLTDEHQNLPGDGAERYRKEYIERAERMQENDPTLSYEMSRLLAQEVPPSKEYVAAYQAWMDAIHELDKAHASYFRLNIWGMGRARQIMWDLEMLKDGDQDPWPDAPEGLDAEKVEALVELFDDEDVPVRQEDLQKHLAGASEYWTEAYGELTFTDGELEAFATYRKAANNVRAANDDSVPGITLYKLGSNDGWLVTPEECSSAVEIWNSTDQATRDAVLAKAVFFQDWVDFLECASQHGGFTVY